ncbi:MAG: hypothetical protein PHD01_15090 [Geobacteraceae bacterium]|nr:hypothetical protein [Geobacteraceae bacterium]
MKITDRENELEDTGLLQIEEEFGDRLCHAFSSCYSVAEIARMTGCKKAIYVYKVLQRRGFIGSIVKRSRFKGPPELEKPLGRMGMSFAQWCNSWRFDPKCAEAELKMIDDSSLAEIHVAARRDFPGTYEKGKGKLNLEEWEREIISCGTVHSFHIDWDHRLERFVGTIPGVESLTVVGKNPSFVMKVLFRAAWLLKVIGMLDGIGKTQAIKI